jgi:tRNA nucleotidyltransferase (CCA-adding enzyme)
VSRVRIDGRCNDALTAQLRVIGETAAEVGAVAWLVGGPVRDLLLGRAAPDLDITVEGSVERVAEALAVRLGGRMCKRTCFLTGTVALPDGSTLDIAQARTERYAEPGALPLVEAATIAEDLRRRDFTVNAMAVALAPGEFGRLLDPHGGLRDLNVGVLRVLHDGSFEDDPTRMVRAARFMLRLGFALEPHTRELLRRATDEGRLAALSGARVRNELRRLFAEAPAEGLGTLQSLGLLEAMGLPPAPGPATRACVALPAALTALGLETADILPLSACLGIYAAHAGIDPAALSERLMLDGGEARDLAAATRLVADFPAALRNATSDAALHAALRGLAATAAAAGWAALDVSARARLERYWHRLRDAVADITGEDLIAAGHEPGPAFAAALEAALAAKLDHAADREQQLTAALAVLNSHERTETQEPPCSYKY